MDWPTIPAGLTLVENPPYAQFHFRPRIVFQFVNICPWNTCKSHIVSSSITSHVPIHDIQVRIDTVYPKCKTIYLILTHWGRVTQICVSKPFIIGWDNGLAPTRRQAIIWANAGIVSMRPLGTTFNESLIEMCKFSFKKIHFKMSSGKWRPSCVGLNVLKLNQR